MALTPKQITIGTLLLVVISTAVYITMSDQLRVRIDDDKSTFYIKNEDNRWIVAGREYNQLYDGTSLMNRAASDIELTEFYDENENLIKVVRITPYQRGPIIIDTYTFDSVNENKEKFPISHKVEIKNAKGYFYRYEVRDLEYSGSSGSVDGVSMDFGYKMRVEWQEGFRWAKVYKDGILKIQYDIKSDDEIFNIRLYDPEILPIDVKYAKILECRNVSEYMSSLATDTVCEEVGVIIDGQKILYDQPEKACNRVKNKLCCWLKKDGGMGLEYRQDEYKVNLKSGESGICGDLSNHLKISDIQSDYGDITFT